MRTLVVSLAVAAFAFTGVVAVHPAGFSGRAVAATAAQDASPAPAPLPAPAAVVHIKNFTYVPDTVTIHPGQAVRFVEDDDAAHTVTASDTSFDSGNLNKKDTWSHTFEAAGTFAYICAYHPYMKGTVIVK